MKKKTCPGHAFGDASCYLCEPSRNSPLKKPKVVMAWALMGPDWFSVHGTRSAAESMKKVVRSPKGYSIISLQEVPKAKKSKKTCVARISMRWGSRVCGRVVRNHSDLCIPCATLLLPIQLIDGILYMGDKDDE